MTHPSMPDQNCVAKCWIAASAVERFHDADFEIRQRSGEIAELDRRLEKERHLAGAETFRFLRQDSIDKQRQADTRRLQALGTIAILKQCPSFDSPCPMIRQAFPDER